MGKGTGGINFLVGAYIDLLSGSGCSFIWKLGTTNHGVDSLAKSGAFF